MTRLLLLSLLTGLLFSPLRGQKLKSDAAFALSARGSEIFQLRAGERFYTYPAVDGWYKARKLVYFQKSDWNDQKLMPEAKLFNEKGEEIGKILAETRVYELDTVEQFRGDTRYRGVISGYIFRTKIAPNSIPEEEISAIFKEKNRNLQKARFDELWALHDAEEKDFGPFTAYAIRAKHQSTRPEQDFRVIVVFRGGTMPYAVITNGQAVELAKVKERIEEGPLLIQSLYKASADQKAYLEQIMFHFLAL